MNANRELLPHSRLRLPTLWAMCARCGAVVALETRTRTTTVAGVEEVGTVGAGEEEEEEEEEQMSSLQR